VIALLVGPTAVIATVAMAAVARQWLGGRTPLAPVPIEAGLLAVVIPARNEAATIGEVIGQVPRASLLEAGWQTRVVVVDDGSSDATAAVARAAGADEVIPHPAGRGLGAAVRTGLARARTSGAAAAVYLDADGEYDPAQLPRLLGPLARGEADYVLGSRFRGKRTGMRTLQTWGNRAFSLLTSILCGQWVTDAQTGYRGFSRRALERVRIIHDYNYAQVLTLALLRRHMRLVEVPVDYRVRQSGRSFVRPLEYCRRVLPAIGRELLAD
jgi:glycosyltransferase involved in cell wall biosynthesis